MTPHCPACRARNIPGADLCEDCGLDLAGLDVERLELDAGDPLLARPLGELPLKEPLRLEGEASVLDAVRLLRERGEGCVLVEDREGSLVGIVTERDVASRVVARERDPRTTPLDEVMTPNPVCLRADDPLAWALHRMGVDGHRHLPVLEGENVKGLLSIRTVLRELSSS